MGSESLGDMAKIMEDRTKTGTQVCLMPELMLHPYCSAHSLANGSDFPYDHSISLLLNNY